MQKLSLKALLLTVASLFLAPVAIAQSRISGLPPGAVVVETRSLAGHNRVLVLWMLNPKRNPNNYGKDEPYTCPDYSRGSYYSGPTRVSLVNSVTNSIINTINITPGDDAEKT